MDPRDAHPLLESLLAFDQGEVALSALDAEELRHLHGLCPECSRSWPAVQELLSRRAAEHQAASPAKATPERRAFEMRLEADRRVAEREVEELTNLSRDERAEKVRRARKRYRTPAFVERMIEEARRWVRYDCGEALALLAIAETRIPTIRRGVYGEPMVRRVALRLLAHQANTHRVLGDLPAADAKFAVIRGRLANEPMDEPTLLAELASLEASLRCDQRRFEDAEGLLYRATSLYRDLGDGVGLAKVQIKRGSILFLAGEPAAGAPYLEAAVAVIDDEAEPQLAFNARHNLLVCLCELGEAAAAQALLEPCRTLARQLDNPTTSSQLTWAEGKVAAALADDDRALERLHAAQHAYAERGHAFDVALVCLDLAEVRLRRGETAEVKRLAERMAPTFAERGVDRETARAVALFCKAARAEAVTLDLIARTRRALLQSRRSDGALAALRPGPAGSPFLLK